MSIKINLTNTKLLDNLANVIENTINTTIKSSVKNFAKKKQQEMVANIDAGGKPTQVLHGLTIAIKGHSKPLFNTGKLRSSIEFIEQNNSDSYNIASGITDKNTYDNGKKVWIVAMVLELGTTISVTDSMRQTLNNFSISAFGHIFSKDIKKIIIPSRPFINPAIRNVRKEINDILKNELKQLKNKIKEKLNA